MTCFIVFYTKMPTELTSFVEQDGHIYLTKDGLQYINLAQKSLRATLRIRYSSPEADANREKTLNQLLCSLKNSGLIWSFQKG
jgi:hypothetical protein